MYGAECHRGKTPTALKGAGRSEAAIAHSRALRSSRSAYSGFMYSECPARGGPLCRPHANSYAFPTAPKSTSRGCAEQ